MVGDRLYNIPTVAGDCVPPEGSDRERVNSAGTAIQWRGTTPSTQQPAASVPWSPPCYTHRDHRATWSSYPTPTLTPLGMELSLVPAAHSSFNVIVACFTFAISHFIPFACLLPV